MQSIFTRGADAYCLRKAHVLFSTPHSPLFPARKISLRREAISYMPSNKRVLCVDDNTDTCALVKETMKGWDVAAEHSSTEGLGRAAAEAFDLILLDYHLPDGTGLDLCRQIRLFDVSTPILLVTVTHSIEHDEVLVAGAQ